MAKTFEMIARYRDESRRISHGSTLCEYCGTVQARNVTEAKAIFTRIAADAVGLPILGVMRR